MWTKLRPRANISADAPAMSLRKNGQIAWNLGLHEALGEPQAVEVLYDPQTRRLAVRKADDAGDAFPVFKARHQRTWQVNALGALRVAGAPVGKRTQRARATEFEPGIWGIELEAEP